MTSWNHNANLIADCCQNRRFSLLLPLHWHSFDPTTSHSQSYTGINQPLWEKQGFFSPDPAHCKFTCLPVQVHRWTGEGRKLTQTGICDLLGWIVEWRTTLLNGLKWIGKDPCMDLCLEFTTLHYWAITLISFSLSWFAHFSSNTAALMMGQLMAARADASALCSVWEVLHWAHLQFSKVSKSCFPYKSC